MTLAGQIALIPDGKRWFQRLIQWVTRSPVHHCVVAISDTECVSAEIQGVIIRPVSHFPKAVWSRFAITDPQRHDIVRFATAQIGKPYALLDDLLIGVALVTRTNTPHWIQDKLMSDDKWQCAELTDAALLAGGINLFPGGRPACAVYPGSFLPLFREHGWWRKTWMTHWRSSS